MGHDMGGFSKHLRDSSEEVATWPEWKRNALGDTRPGLTRKEEDLELIPDRAVEILEQAIANIKARGKSYNSNAVNYHDYKLNGIDTCWADQLECMVRLWHGGGDDKAADWAAYTALSAAFFEQGIPQSRFSPIYRQLLPRIEAAIKSG